MYWSARAIAIATFFLPNLSFAQFCSEAYQPWFHKLWQGEGVLIVGAGPAGETTSVQLSKKGIVHEIVESSHNFGGIWNLDRSESPIYEGVNFNSSFRMTRFKEFPMETEHPFASAPEAFEYLKSYARHFGLHRHTRFGLKVQWTERQDGYWVAHFSDGSTRRYQKIIVAAGAQWHRKMPGFVERSDTVIPIIHAFDYKGPAEFDMYDRVVVVGGGNTAADIAAQAGQTGVRKTYWSMRRGYHIVPRMVAGQPADQYSAPFMWAPTWIQRLGDRFILSFIFGKPENHGFQKPTEPLMSTQPLFAGEAVEQVSKGRVEVVKDIDRVEGSTVYLKDGSRLENIDAIVVATGYEFKIPFIESKYLALEGGLPRLYLNVFHPERDDIFFIGGHLEVTTGGWQIYETLGNLIATSIEAQNKGRPGFERFVRAKTRPWKDLKKGHFKAPLDRNRYGVHWHAYLKEVDREIRRMGGAPIKEVSELQFPGSQEE